MASAAAATECRLPARALLPRYALRDKDLLLSVLARSAINAMPDKARPAFQVSLLAKSVLLLWPWLNSWLSCSLMRNHLECPVLPRLTFNQQPQLTP